MKQRNSLKNRTLTSCAIHRVHLGRIGLDDNKETLREELGERTVEGSQRDVLALAQEWRNDAEPNFGSGCRTGYVAARYDDGSSEHLASDAWTAVALAEQIDTAEPTVC